jgi:hypothetical protein
MRLGSVTRLTTLRTKVRGKVKCPPKYERRNVTWQRRLDLAGRSCPAELACSHQACEGLRVAVP